MAAPTGKNPSVVNLESKASAMQKPKIAPCRGPGSSAQTSIARKAAPRHAAKPHVRGGQAGMRKDGGDQCEQESGDHSGSDAEVAARPVEDHQAAQHEEWQDAEPHAA